MPNYDVRLYFDRLDKKEWLNILHTKYIVVDTKNETYKAQMKT